MYRQYEDPHKLERMLAEAIARTQEPGYEIDEYDIETIEGLRERINFAWQDDEYDMMCAAMA